MALKPTVLPIPENRPSFDIPLTRLVMHVFPEKAVSTLKSCKKKKEIEKKHDQNECGDLAQCKL